MRRYHSPQEVDKLRSEERIAREVVEAEGLPFNHMDLSEPHVEEFLQKRWLRQRTGQSTRECCRGLEHVLGQRLVEDQIGDGDASPGPQHP